VVNKEQESSIAKNKGGKRGGTLGNRKFKKSPQAQSRRIFPEGGEQKEGKREVNRFLQTLCRAVKSRGEWGQQKGKVSNKQGPTYTERGSEKKTSKDDRVKGGMREPSIKQGKKNDRKEIRGAIKGGEET